MTEPRNADHLIRAFLADGPTELPDRAYDAVRDRIDKTRQRVVIGPWREPRMTNIARVAIGAAAAVLIAIMGINLNNDFGPGRPSPSPSPTPTPILLPPTAAVGPLGAGSYVTDGDWADTSVFLPVTVTLPDGWGNAGWAFERPPGLTGHGTVRAGDAWVSIWTVDNVYLDPCRYKTTAMDPLLGPSVGAFVTAMGQQANSHASAPSPVTIDGFSGQVFEIEVPADVNARTCEGTEYRLWIAPGSGDPSRNTGNFAGLKDTLWVLDVRGIRLVIESIRPMTATAAQVADVEAIVESIRFGPIQPEGPSPAPSAAPIPTP